MVKATSILIIEDEAILRDSIADYLEDRDFRVLTAENGRVGIETFIRENPELVMTDLRMPEVDGLEVLRRIVEISPGTPLIVVSGTGRIGDSIQALRLGAWDYIIKPIEDMSILHHAINKALQHASLLKENRDYQEKLETLVDERTTELELVNADLTSINNRLRGIVDSTQKLTACREVVEFGPLLLREFAEHMSAAGGSIYFLEEDNLRLLHTLDSGHVPLKIPFPLDKNSIIGRVFEEKKPILIKDMTSEFNTRASGWDGYANGSVLAFPLPDGSGKIIGVLTLHNKTSPPFIEQDKEIGTILASHGCETIRVIQATETVRASEARFRDLTDMLPEAVVEFNLNLEPTYVNQRGYEMFGYGREDLKLKLKAFDLLVPEERAVARDNLSKRIKGKHIGTVEYTALRKDGSTFPALINLAPILAEGEMTGFRGIIVDISERQHAENERMRLETQLRQTQKLEAIGTLAGGIAHDFNNILFAILGYADLATDTIPEDNPALENITEVIKAGHRAEELVRQILTFARKADKKPTAIRISTIVKEVVKMMHATLPTTIEIKQRIKTARTTIIADPTEIHQVIMNLCTNAGFALMKDGGKLEISLTGIVVDNLVRQQHPDLETGPHLVLSVEDTGPGISTEDQLRIFEPFFTTKDKGEGTGMGLAVVHGIVQSLGGSISVFSEIGEGTSFKVYLPLSVSAVSNQAGKSDAIPRGTERILIVDDEPALTNLIKRMLELLGYTVNAFNSGQQALGAYRDSPDQYDIVIMDQTMPIMTGAELAESILRINPAQRTVLISGFSHTVSSEKADEFGISAYLSKPISKIDLAETIRRVLDGTSAPDSPELN